VELKVLTEAQVAHFIDKGWVVVEEAYPREKAEACQQYLWDRLREGYGIEREDKSTWTKPMIYHQVAYRSPEFDACNSVRLGDAIEDLVGAGRWSERVIFDGTDRDYPTWGWWPVNFSMGGEEAWDVPTAGWHWDGQHFHHFVDSPDQGLLCLCLFSDIGPQGGGTLVAEGSHKVVAQYLSRFPEGVDVHEGIREVNRTHPWIAELTGNLAPEESGISRIERFMNRTHRDENGFELRVVETTGKPGDVILCHPFLYHTASQNHCGVPRFMCNRTTPLFEKMNLARESASEYSPLETSIRLALG
jgi:Phytanoyl-CoA dioxygenase (PhyH)